jgi:hypothetical protein
MAGEDVNTELETLRAHNAKLAAALSKRRRGRLRATASWTLLVLGCVLAMLAVVANWARRQVVDTDRYVETVAPLAHDPAIQSLITDKLTAVVAEPQRTASLAREALPPRAEPLATPLAAALQRYVHDKVGEFVRSERFVELWANVNRRSHEAAVELLTGEDLGRVQIVRDRLVVQLSPIVPRLQEALLRAGIDISEALPIETTDDEQTQLVLADASAIQSARGGVRVLKGLALLLPLLGLICLAGAIALAADRRKGVLRAGAGIAIAMVTLGVIIGVARSLYLDAVVSSDFPEAAATAFYDAILHFLRVALRIVLAAGLVVALGAVLVGPARPAVALRRALGSLGARGGAAGVQPGWFGRWVGRYRHALEWSTAVIGGVVLVSLSAPSGAAVLKIGVAVLAAVALIELIAATASGAIGTPPSTPTRTPPPTAT